MDCEYTIIYIWRKSVLEYFTLNIFCLSELLVFLELRSRKTTHVKKLLLYNFLRFASLLPINMLRYSHWFGSVPLCFDLWQRYKCSNSKLYFWAMIMTIVTAFRMIFIRCNYLLMCFWCKFYLDQFSYSSPGFSHNTAVEKQIFSLVHQTSSAPIRNKRSNIGNTYSYSFNGFTFTSPYSNSAWLKSP